MGEFDVNLYASILDEMDHEDEETVMVEEPAVSLATDLKEAVAAAEQALPAEKKQAEAAPEDQAGSGQGESKTSTDWLSSHMDLLNKLK